MVNKYDPEMIGWYFIDREGVQIYYPKEGIWPEMYLSYAQADYAGYEQYSESRCLINAVSNAKRALHYQVEGLAYALGWKLTKGKKDFPSKLEFLGKCGVLSPAIIKRINKLRNTVEHEYYTPTGDEALEYIEIVELYLAATSVFSRYFPVDVTVELMTDDPSFDPKWGLPEFIKISLPEGKGRIIVEADGEQIVEADISDEKYFAWVDAVMRQISY
ncbi:hypothetical protein [Pseudomonas sp. PL-6]